MGSKKKKASEPWISKFTREIQSRPTADISPFIKSIEHKISQHEQKIKQNIETEQTDRLKRLQLALMNAIGSLQYNPYAEKTKEAFLKIQQQKLEPLQQTKSQAISQYTAINPEVSKALRMAGAYKWAKESPTATGAQDILSLYKTTYESGMQFIEQTKNFLKDLGYDDNELEETMKPYYSLTEEGYFLRGGIKWDMKKEKQ